MRYLSLLLFLLFVSCGDTAPSDSEVKTEVPTFQNPVLTGFYPDPALCEANGKFYLTTSTFAYFPGLPIFESDDLVSWKQVGNAMNRASQMQLEGLGISRGNFAPGISFHDGVFYVVCTLADAGGNYIVTATDPAGPWSDSYFLPEVDGIDPSTFFEGDKSYLVYNSIPPDNKSLYSGHRTIRMVEFDRETMEVLGENKILVNGGTDISKEPVWIEAPHIYHINDFYYLMCAEGGTGPQHSEVIFRSKELWGPYEPWENNPILTQRHLDPNRPNPVTTAGHADMVQLDNGDWWAVFLAVRPYEGNYFNTGRETFLAPVRWTDDGWPVINPDFEEVQYSYPMPSGAPADTTLPRFAGNFTFRDEFSEDSLNLRYLLLRTPTERWYQLEDSQLKLRLRPTTVNERSNPSYVGFRQHHLAGEAATLVSFTPEAEGERAGLVVFQSSEHHYTFVKTIVGDQETVQLLKASEEVNEVLAEASIAEGPLRLRVSFENDKYNFSYAEEGAEEYITLVADVAGKYLSTQEAGGFVGVTIGMYATSSGKNSDQVAAFDWFSYTGDDQIFRK
ncbi:glycoside hydrolase family 43 protein [Lewinella sp. W8]|uniref:glycoside hydrolase family 43 protein n=1 Tax=Lewinella sp. W8 TaxID=2528208 RepID=UPI0010679F97|nr:glycoside hydrolase family 43 protein [Lewinella sp. W8]MTB50423.1 family 43 glycosylhydrolase [Lewinella sp. W8]